jgi:hypothetical protein
MRFLRFVVRVVRWFASFGFDEDHAARAELKAR